MPHKPPTHRPTQPQLPRHEGRPNSAARGYGRDWRKIRLAVLSMRPICEECECKVAEHVDHVRAIVKGGGNELTNLRALCHSCHSRKTVAEDNGFGRGRGRG